MSTEKDSILRVRLTQRQSDELDAIIDELQAQMPVKEMKLQPGNRLVDSKGSVLVVEEKA